MRAVLGKVLAAAAIWFGVFVVLTGLGIDPVLGFFASIAVAVAAGVLMERRRQRANALAAPSGKLLKRLQEAEGKAGKQSEEPDQSAEDFVPPWSSDHINPALPVAAPMETDENSGHATVTIKFTQPISHPARVSILYVYGPNNDRCPESRVVKVSSMTVCRRRKPMPPGAPKKLWLVPLQLEAWCEERLADRTFKYCRIMSASVPVKGKKKPPVHLDNLGAWLLTHPYVAYMRNTGEVVDLTAYLHPED